MSTHLSLLLALLGTDAQRTTTTNARKRNGTASISNHKALDEVFESQ